MPHITNLISDIQLPSGELYEIHDKYAIHDISELGVAGALVFKGTLADCDALAAIAPEASKNGYVYLVTSVTASTSAGKQLIPAGWDDTPYASSLEYVCIQVNDSNTYKWEPLGNIHDAASSTHKHNVVVTGKNSTSTVSGSMSIPKVTPS